MSTYKTKCDICGTENEVPNYGDWNCRQCGQGYDYDEGHRIRLTPEQLATLRQMPRWISVEERLPEDGRAVLVCWSARTCMMGVGQMRNGQWLYKYDIDDDEWAAAMEKPTHWMPLPEPPRP